jgi:hypothetical protein
MKIIISWHLDDFYVTYHEWQKGLEGKHKYTLSIIMLEYVKPKKNQHKNLNFILFIEMFLKEFTYVFNSSHIRHSR